MRTTDSQPGRAVEPLLERGSCHDHPGQPAIAVCSGCAAFVCRPCHDAGVQGFELYCPGCRGADPDALEEAWVRAGEATSQAAGEAIPATFFPRLLAYLLDSMLLDGVRAGLYLLLGWDLSNLPQGSLPPAPVLALALVLHAVYHIVFWALFGATPGKALLGLRVVRAADGGPLGWGMAAQRWLGYMLSTLSLGLGFLAILWDRRRLGWHDRLAGTRVVRIGLGGWGR